MRYFFQGERGKANNQVLKACRELANEITGTEDSLIFDFSHYEENNPFGNLVLINTLKRYRKKFSNIPMSCHPKEEGGYLSHIGFYKACGIPFGKEVGEAKASSNYVPVTEINLYGEDFYRSIDDRAEQLADTLQFDEGLQQLLKYIFVETIRNVFEHSGAETVFVAAQKWQTIDTVEIAISDAGCGISGSLSKFFATDEANLLRLACKPGVSARSNYRYLENDNPWRNSGYGLFIMKELALAYGGSFILCSGNNAIRYSADEYMTEKEEIISTDYLGTTIGIRLKTNTGNDFDKVRKRIVTIGELRSEQIKGAIRTASRSSGGRYHLDN